MVQTTGRTAAIGLLLAACGAPLQGGEVSVLPGSAERLMLALRMGLAVPGDGIPEVATTRRIVSSELLSEGDVPRSRLGDYLLENRRIRAVVAQPDGSARGGMLVDLAFRGRERDGFDGMATAVFGRRVRYASIKEGYDEATASAFVSVTGSPEGLPGVEVQTRYDVAPGLANVVVHTTVKTDATPSDVPLVVDTLASPRSRFVTQGEGVGVFGGEGASFGVKPLLADPPGAFSSTAADGRGTLVVVTDDQGAPLYLYSRLIAPLERPDTLALAAGLAQDEPGSVTDIEVGLVAPHAGMVPLEGTFQVERLDGDRGAYELVPPGPVRPGDRISARVPAGRYRIHFSSRTAASHTQDAEFTVKRGQRARVDLLVDEGASSSPEAAATALPVVPR